VEQQAPTAPPRNRMRVDLIVCGFAPGNRLHGKRVAQDEGNTLSGAEVGEPAPGNDAVDADDEIRPGGGKGFSKWVGGRLHRLGLTDRSILVQDAQIQASGVESEATRQRG
jgi:hypothetical protein